jgi:oligopeptide transport system permease protein
MGKIVSVYLWPRLLALLAIITLTFTLMKVLPGDPFTDEQALPASIHQALRTHYGLEDPWLTQYVRYLKRIVTWDLGPSFRYKDQTVNEMIAEGFPVSALLGLEALVLALTLGITLGAFSAFYPHRWPDVGAFCLIALAISVPSFILGALLQYVFALKWGLLPVARWGTFSHSILPALALAALPCAFIARLVRANLSEVLKQDYIRTARAKGLSETRILFVHALRNAVLPVVSYLGPLSANVLLGSFVVEKIYAIPGLGQSFVNSVLNRDYTVIMGCTVFYSVIMLTLLLVVDLVYCLIDPRLRRSLAT